MTRFLLPAILLLVLLPAALADPDEAEEAAREYARRALISQARVVAGQGTIRSGDLVAMRRTLTDDINFLTSVEAQSDEDRAQLDLLQRTVEARILFLGEPLTDEPLPAEASEGETRPEKQERDGLRGAAGEAVRLLRWLRGEEQCGVVVDTLRGDVVVGETRAYRYDPNALRSSAEPQVPPVAGDGAGPQAKSGAAAGQPAKEDAQGPPDEEPTDRQPTDEGTQEESAPPSEDGGEKATSEPSPPPKPLTPTEWARDVVLAKEKTLLDKRLMPARCSEVSHLIELSERPVDYLDAYAPPLHRRPLASSTPFGYNLPFIRLRELQTQERQHAISEESTTGGLVDESLVREQTRRATEYREVANAVRAERDRLLAFLDQMTVDRIEWREQAAVLSGRIQGEKRRLEETLTEEQREAGETPEASLLLRAMEAQEAVISLDLRIFYHTVLRAEYRLELVRDHMTISEMVAQSAEAKRDEFARALDQVRNARQIDRLRSDVHLMRKAIEYEQERKEKSRSDRPELRIAALEATIDVNEIVQDAVARRRVASSPRLAQADEDEEAAFEEAAPPDEEAPAKEAAAAARDLAEDDPRRKLSAIARKPYLHIWSLSTVYALAAELQDESLRDAYDASLIAAHYSAATKQIVALEHALATTMGDGELRARFDEAYVRAEAALAPLEELKDYVGTTRLRPALASLETDFDHSMTALAARRQEHEEHLEALRAYRASLLELGSLSLAVRTDTDLEPGELWEAGKDSLRTLKQLKSFLNPMNENGLFGLAAKNWLAVLGALALLAAVVLGVRRLRVGMDQWLERQAAQIPQLRWTGASVRQERRHAQERKRREDQAAHAVTEEARLQATAPPEAVSDIEESKDDAKEEEGEEGEEAAKAKAASTDASTSAPADGDKEEARR